MTKDWRLAAFSALLGLCMLWGWSPRQVGADEETPVEPDKIAAALAQQMRSRFYADRHKAALKLIEMGKPAMAELRKGMTDSDARFAIDCIDLLLVLGDKSILPDLIRIAHTSRYAMMRETALRAIDVMDPFQEMTARLAEGELKEAADAVKKELETREISDVLTADIEQYVVPDREARNTAAVYGIMDNADAAALVEKAGAFSEQGRTEEALKICQEILKMRISGCVPDPDEASHLTGLTPASLPILRNMDADTLKKYRAMFDEEAESALATAKIKGGYPICTMF